VAQHHGLSHEREQAAAVVPVLGARRAGGLIANTPVRDQDGVSGLWRFDPPGGHGILGRADVQAQAFGFLGSNGTEIIDPT